MALLIAAKHFVQRKVSNCCFIDLLESYNQLRCVWSLT